MSTPDTKPQTASLTRLQPATGKTSAEALAVLEQMFGYFSFEPLPFEAAAPRLAA